MRLERLFLHGFKSFADRTELRFHNGITAIVGPNGCGKSNISDAIRWVLGEQRASAIRGSKMEEAIFQGTSDRRPLNRAEVGLVFSNEDRRLAVPYEEIEIRRTIFREGGSEYQLNRTPCRLKDIFDLYRDTGLGANAYAIIEQRMVDGILSDRTDDRRQLFEEAAGIGRYKDRRKAAQRRLESAEADLARLEDLIGEVDAKVRSLARQRRRAQRYHELRARRLSLEVTLAAAELETLRVEMAGVTARLTELTQDEPAGRAALSAAEAELEQRRLESAEAARARGAIAARVEEVGRRISERDRELAVADERRTHAERRLAQIAVERTELQHRVETLRREIDTLTGERAAQVERLETLGGQVEEVQGRQDALRAEVSEARSSHERARVEEKRLAERAAQADSAALSGEARLAEYIARLERLRAEREELSVEQERHGEQGDLFAEQVRGLAVSRAEREAEREECAERLTVLRAGESEARRVLLAAEDRYNLLAAQRAALEALERDYHGFAAPVAAALVARGRLDGLHGPLAEFLRLPPDRAAEVENALSSLLKVLVVEDPTVADTVREWLAAEGPDEGALALLPRALLPHLEKLIDGMLFAGRPPTEPVLLGRRERLAALREEVAQAEAEREESVRSRSALLEEIESAEAELRERAAVLESLDRELRRTEAEEATWTSQQERLARSLEELGRQEADLVATMERVREEAALARGERSRLEEELSELRGAWQEKSDAIAGLEAAWEAVRDEASELRVVHARAEAGVGELDRRLTAARGGLDQARVRLDALEKEEVEHRRTLTQLEGIRSDAGVELEDLFRQRDSLATELLGMDERINTLAATTEALEVRARILRRSGEERSEERHRLELRRAEGEAAGRSVRERLEAEWGRPFEQLLSDADPAEGEPHALRAELLAVAADIERLGPINMLAVEEHEEENERLTFLTGQRDDLVRARDDLQTAIRQINRQARELFTETFEKVRANFQRTFQTLFEGGSCDLWLADPDDPLESAIEVSASPKGKRTQRIHLLSGGERALTALSLLFAIYLVKPSPFCVLDEVDAPLDEANVGRFISMLQEFKAGTQFIVITHNPRTMEAADWIYGVTMEEPGISTIVGVQLNDQAPAGAPAVV